MTTQHDIRLVLLAAAICFLSCYTATGLAYRVRPARSVRRRLFWVAATATVFGAGTWATHFLAMLAYDVGIPINYDVGVTALSVAVAILISGVGVAIGFVGYRPLLGGAINGAAVAAMHFIGIAAIRAPGTITWDWSYAIVAVVISVGGGVMSLLVGMWRGSRTARAFGPAVMGLAIIGMHFTAMTAITWTYAPTMLGPMLPDETSSLAIAVAVVTVLILLTGLGGSFIDQQLAKRSAREAGLLREYVVELELTKAELEQRTREATEALEVAAASSQAKSQFLANMSHELRTPLNAIIGYSSMQVEGLLGPVDNQEYKETSKHILEAGRHLLSLINDILDLTRLDSVNLELDQEEVDVGDLIGKVTALVELQACEARLELRVTNLDGMPHLIGDPRRLRQVLLNLVSNAIKFTPSGGRVDISARVDGDGIAIAVADTGIGMTPESLAVAFERFGQVENGLARKYDGAGLGLPLARQFVELHDGTIKVDSEPGIGTTITVRLPSARLVPRSAAA